MLSAHLPGFLRGSVAGGLAILLVLGGCSAEDRTATVNETAAAVTPNRFQLPDR